MTVQICSAQNTDIAAILEIYNDAVLNTAASWDYDLLRLNSGHSGLNSTGSKGFPCSWREMRQVVW
jgi:L-amino acid N-acyltransferase YncA